MLHIKKPVVKSDQQPALYSKDRTSKKTTLMQCINTPIKGHDIYVLFDSGCDKSYVTNACAKKLKLKFHGQEDMNCSGFADMTETNVVIYVKWMYMVTI